MLHCAGGRLSHSPELFLNSVGQKLLVAIALPAIAVALWGLLMTWRRTDDAVRADIQADALGYATFLATSFGAVEDVRPGTPPRVAHRAVTLALRSNWSALRAVGDVRIVDAKGVVRWSRRIEEEDKALPDAGRILGSRGVTASFEGGAGWPWSPARGGEVLSQLGGVGCGGCHFGDATLRTGYLQLTVDAPALRREVSDVFLNATMAVLVFSLVLIGASALGLRIFLTRPLTRLVTVMRRAEGGELLVRAPVMGRDEIGRLSIAYNRMLARLTELKAVDIDRQADLDKAHAELVLKEELEQLNTKLEVRLEELQGLFELARTINSTLDLEQVLDRVASTVPKFGVPKFSIMLLNPEGLLEVVKARTGNPNSVGLSFAIGEGICGRAAQILRSVYVPDLEAPSPFKVRGGEGSRGRGCLLAVPMLHADELFGVLNFERGEKADFSSDEIEFFTAVTDQAAMAVANARLHEQTVTLSITDPLTGVPNRRHLFQQLESEINRANRFGTQLSMLMIDIDFFKHLNDTAGHRAGDEVLREVCRLLKKNLRKVDTLARYGGEEFAVLLPQVPRHEAVDVAEKLRRAVEEAPLEHGKTQPMGKVTISVGVASLPVDATDQARLVDCADSALYASKRGGRNKVSAFENGMETHPGRERGPRPAARPN